MTYLDVITDDEYRRCAPADDDTGFGALATDAGRLPLVEMQVRSVIVGLVAHTTLRQTFVNSFDRPIEATYIFPLPDRAAVTGFRMEIGDRVIDGVIKERGEARADYDQALADGHRAAITEEERSGVFTVRVGNLMPGEQGSVRLTLTGPLPYSDGEVTFRFPLVVAPRYIPGAPLPGPAGPRGASVGDGVAVDTDAVPDASRITPPVLLPGFPNPVRLALEVSVDPAGLALGAPRASLHTVEQLEGGRLLRLHPGERLDRDFIVRFALGDESVGSALSIAADDGGEHATFALTLVPPAGAARADKPRDVVFVLDRSGSMSGWKMVAARRATARMVDTLGDRDRFSVYTFDNVVEAPPAFAGFELVQATDRNRFRAVEFLAGVDGRGGTELAEPLRLAAERLRGGYDDRERVLVLITDGQVGNEDQILRRLGGELRNARVFTLGIDRAVNEGFLRRLAALGAGSFELVESEDRLDDVMDRVHRRIATPVLTELALEAEGMELDRASIAPARLPDLFAGAPVVVTGRCRLAGPPDAAAVRLRARDAVGEGVTERIAGRAMDRGASGALGVVWARAHIRDLEDRYATGDTSVEPRVLQTSLRWGVLSRFTAFVAIDRSEKVNAGGEVHRVTQAVEPASGWDMLAPTGVGMAPMQAMAGAPPAPGAMPPMPMKTMALGAPPRRRESILSRAAGALRGRLSGGPPEEAEAEAAFDEAALDLAPYRARAKKMLDQLTAGADLRRIAVALRELIEDLESIGADPTDLDPLRELAAALRAGTAEEAGVRRVLATFAGERGASFWR